MRHLVSILAIAGFLLAVPAQNLYAGTCICLKFSTNCNQRYTVSSEAACQNTCAAADRCGAGATGSFTEDSGESNLPTPPKGLGASVGLFKEAGTKAGFPEGAVPPEVVIGQLIRALIVLMGMIFGVLMVYAGFLWMTARGNDEYVKKAKNILESATIGIIIVVAAYAITTFVVDKVISSSFQQGTSNNAPPNCTGTGTDTDPRCGTGT